MATQAPPQEQPYIIPQTEQQPAPQAPAQQPFQLPARPSVPFHQNETVQSILNSVQEIPAATKVIAGLGLIGTVINSHIVSYHYMENRPYGMLYTPLTAPWANSYFSLIISLLFLFPVSAAYENKVGSIKHFLTFLYYNLLIQLGSITTHFGEDFRSAGFFAVTLLYLTKLGLEKREEMTSLFMISGFQVKAYFAPVIFGIITLVLRSSDKRVELFTAIIVAVLLHFGIFPDLPVKNEKIALIEGLGSISNLSGFVKIGEVSALKAALLPESSETSSSAVSSGPAIPGLVIPQTTPTPEPRRDVESQ